MRIRITFSKTEAMRYTGHLDLHRTWERTLRRAGLPLAYSQGFSPHPKINLASALPLGCTAENEVIDVWLETDSSLSEVFDRVTQACPPGLMIKLVEQVDERAPTLQTTVHASEYLITFLVAVPDLDAKVASLIEASNLLRERRGKSYDLRLLILRLECLQPDIQGNQRIFAQLTARESATGRPEEIAATLNVNIKDVRVHRSRLIFS